MSYLDDIHHGCGKYRSYTARRHMSVDITLHVNSREIYRGLCIDFFAATACPRQLKGRCSHAIQIPKRPIARTNAGYATDAAKEIRDDEVLSTVMIAKSCIKADLVRR